MKQVKLHRRKLPICPVCSSWMLTKPALPVNWLRCVGCGFMEKESKTIIKPVGDK